MHYRLAHPGQGILGPAPAIYASQPTTLPSALITMPLQDPTWHMDTCASSHLNFNASNLYTIFDKRLFPSVHVGDDKSIPVTNTDHIIIPFHHRPLQLHNVLVTPNIIKNLIFVRQITRDNNCTIDVTARAISIQLPSRQLFPLLFSRQVLLRGINASDIQSSQVAYLLIYVDDIILIASCPALPQQIIGTLNNEFDMTDLEALNYFLGISANRTPTGLFLSQKKYALQLLEHAHMVTCNPFRTPIDTESKLGLEVAPVQDPTLYRSLVGGLQFLTFTRLDLSYAVQHIFLYMHDPREPHLAALKRILRYVQGTLDLGLHLYVSSTTSLVGYTNADWASCPSTRRFTSGYCVFLGDNLLSWSVKRQHTLSRSSAEAEYRGVANVVAETACFIIFFVSYTLLYRLQL
ncbi:ribonuclease H-like domain-containing protein [Tanacetum coccineum]|uniref:Ribonuclease H-like domain-containing protein n=1 Tax=Tanacetum coccineum TaxID=301880 RepID=A0ABQ5F4J1_9ASTR